MLNGRSSAPWSKSRAKGREIGCLMKTKGVSATKLSLAVILGLSHPMFLCLESHMLARKAESESASDDDRQSHEEPAHT